MLLCLRGRWLLGDVLEMWPQGLLGWPCLSLLLPGDTCSSCHQARAQLSALGHQRQLRACGSGGLGQYQALPHLAVPLVAQHVDRLSPGPGPGKAFPLP